MLATIFVQLLWLSLLLPHQAFVPLAKTITRQRTAATVSEIPPHVEKPMKVLLLVEPTPFNYVSGYANRFKEMLKYLKNAGDEVSIITPDADPNRPTDFLGYPITSARGFEFPLYKFVTVTFDLKGNVLKLIKEFKPDIIHVSSPSAILNPAILWARLLDVPLLMSYHTDLVSYARAYANVPGSIELAKFCIGYYHQFADLVLCTSPQLQETLTQAGVRRVDVWQKGINTEVFSPTFRDAKMRARLSDGHPEAPLLLYVGRLGYEKKLDRLKAVLDANPGARLALVGKGPAEADLRELFRDYPVHFAGQVVGEELSQAYASVDIFTMPSDSETLGFVVMESMASGVPVVGVGAGGVVDLIQPMKTGLLAVNKDDMVQFSRHVKDLIADEPLRKQMGQQGWEWAQGWSWEAATARLRNVHYRRAIAIHRSRDESGAHVREIEDALMQRI